MGAMEEGEVKGVFEEVEGVDVVRGVEVHRLSLISLV